MQVLEALAAAFINTFGITQPTDKTRRMVAWFILSLLLLVIVVLIVGGLVVSKVLHP